MGGKVQIVLAAHFLNDLDETSLSNSLAKIHVAAVIGEKLYIWVKWTPSQALFAPAFCSLPTTLDMGLIQNLPPLSLLPPFLRLPP